ncbi:MAG: hypothetical protein HOY76_27320 [Streptomyces sp.]|nr:hypothetical protein [Streptomyces sp.]
MHILSACDRLPDPFDRIVSSGRLVTTIPSTHLVLTAAKDADGFGAPGPNRTGRATSQHKEALCGIRADVGRSGPSSS